MRFHGVPWRGLSGDARERPRALQQWVLRPLLALSGLVWAIVVALLILAHCLDLPWLKRRVQELARTAAGVDIDYRDIRVALLSGVAIEGLVVRSPLEVRNLAPDLLAVGHVEARWSLGSLLGHRPEIEQLAVSEVTLTVVVDEHGRASFDALPQSGASADRRPPLPLSRRAASWLATPPPLGKAIVDGVALTLVRTEQGHVAERTSVRGVSLAFEATPTANGWRAQAGLGSPAAPLDLQVDHAPADAPAGAARATLWLTIDATSSALTAGVDLHVLEQTFSPNLPVDERLHAEASARFDAIAGRTEITLDHTDFGQGMATATASVELPDSGDPIVRHAQGDVDLARLLRLVPVGLVPVTAERAQLRYQVDSLVAGPVVHLSEGGAVDVDADLSNAVVAAPFGRIQVDGGQLSLRAQPATGGGTAGRGSVKLVGTRLASGKDRLAADDLAVDFEGQQGNDAMVAGSVGVRFARLERAGASPVVARGGLAELRVQGMHLDTEDPLASQGDLALSIALASLDIRSLETRAVVDGLRLGVHTTLEGHAPYAVEVEAPVTRLRVTGQDGKLFTDAPARIECRARDIQPDVAHPVASRGVVHAVVDLGETHASLDAPKGPDAIDFAFRATARSLDAVRPFLPAALISEAPWDRMAVSVRANGSVEHLGAGGPAVRQTTEVDIEHPAFENVAARSLSLIIKSKGTALQHQADIDVRAQGLTLDGGSPSDDHISLSAAVNREHPSLQFQLATEGRAATKLSGSLSFDPARRAIPYQIEGHLAGLAPFAPLAAKVRGIDGFDLSQVEVGLSARGALLGVVAGIARDGTIELEPSPARTAAIEGKTDLQVTHFRWAKGDTAIATPALAWHGDMRADRGRRTLESGVEIGSLHLHLGTHDVDLNGIGDEARVAVTGNLGDPKVELTQHLSVRAVGQDVVPEYPLGDLAFELSAERGPEGVVHISDMKVANGLGGTALEATGNVDLGAGRRTLSVATSLTQNLARLSTIPERFKGRGSMAVEANVTSPDLRHCQVRATLRGDDVTLDLPRAGIAVEGANGEVPVTVALDVGDNGVAFPRSEKQSPYSMLRFTDQHPLLSHSGFLSIARLKTPFVSIAPLVGNLAIEQNVVSLGQFEMGVRGGSITGQCSIDWDGPKSSLELHVRASGVQSSHGEPFDGNIEVVLSAADRTLEGRAEILRIGERHLLDLLDLQDPLHVDPAMNRIRAALRFGYPDNLRLVFDHGFASAHLELGGLARFVNISDLRGIPMGPIVDKMLAPLLDTPDTKETP
jgi:translocation and assembly module TamB